MPPPALVNAAVAAHLAEARKHLRVEAEWIEPSDPGCTGRAVGFWRVMAGPKDGQTSGLAGSRRYADPTGDAGPCTVDAKDLSEATALALDTIADRHQPDDGKSQGRVEVLMRCPLASAAAS